MMQLIEWLQARYLIIKRIFERERFTGKVGFLLLENAGYLYPKFCCLALVLLYVAA